MLSRGDDSERKEAGTLSSLPTTKVRFLIVPLSLMILCLANGPGLAQELRELVPLPVPPQVEAPEEVPPERKPPLVMDETVMVETLKGLIFVTNSDQVQAQPPVPEDGLDVSKVPTLQTPEARKVVDEHLGKPVSMASLNRLVASLYLYYSRIDLPFVSITLPEQDITGGVVQVLVIKGQLGEIRIEGARYFSEDLYRSQLRLRPGEPIRKSVIDRDVDWINRNPFRRAGMFVEPGKEVGTTNLALRVRERFPLRVYGGYNNAGTETTGEDRMFFGANWGNAFGLGHQLNYQFTSSTDLEKSVGHGASYIVPLPWCHFLTLYGAYSRIKSHVPEPLAREGESSQLSLRYEAPLPEIGAYTQSVSGLFDFKKSDNNLEFGGITVTDNVTHILQWGLQYNGSLPHAWGVTSFSGRLTYSPGDLSSRNRDEYFSVSRAFAEAEYLYATFDLSRTQRLPADFALLLTGTVQFSNRNLLGSEQLEFGGANTVRGYDEGEVYRDRGYLLKLELAAPPIRLSRWLGVEAVTDQLQLYAFHDYGVARSVDLLPGEDPTIILQSVGLGLRYYVGRYFSLNFAYGWQQKAVEGAERSSRSHVSAVLSF